MLSHTKTSPPYAQITILANTNKPHPHTHLYLWCLVYMYLYISTASESLQTKLLIDKLFPGENEGQFHEPKISSCIQVLLNVVAWAQLGMSSLLACSIQHGYMCDFDSHILEKPPVLSAGYGLQYKLMSRAYRAAKWREGMQLLDNEIFIVTKIRGYTHQNVDIEKKGLWLMTKQPFHPHQSRFSTTCSILSVCRNSPRYNNPLLFLVFFQAQAWGAGCCNSFLD